MISIKRSDCPKVLKDTPITGTHYNKKPVVKALWKMQHKKCCYCEQEIPEDGHLKAVEHFHPKSIYTGLRNDWKNLLLACAQCNGRKSNRFPIMLTDNANEPKLVFLKKSDQGKPLLIDPSDESLDPEEHITFIVDDTRVEEYGLPTEKNNSERGRMTIDIVGLDGSFYFRKRRSWHRTLESLYLNLLEAKDQENQQQVLTYCDRFRQFMSAKKEFSAYTREFARHKGLDRNFGIAIPRRYEV